MFSNIDRTRLSSEIAALAADCIHLKGLLRTKWVKPMADEQQRLVRVRRKLTELHVLLALSRKRLHIVHAPREVRDVPNWDAATWNAQAFNEAIASRLLPEYAVATTMAAEGQAVSL